MKQITENMNEHKIWYEEAAKQTLETLPKFIDHLLNDYSHDYGTICHALTAGGIATMWAMNNSPQGGITGFQAGAIMWEFIRNWNNNHNKTGLRLIDYDNMLYPQYAEQFDKTISKDVWDALQDEALSKLAEADQLHEQYLKDMDAYKIDIAKFIEKYPDFKTNPEKYERLSFGTGIQWDEYHKKEKEGFEFAPTKPYKGIKGNAVYKHWETIANGKIPFGYKISND